jgi:hypothetical protein
MEQTIKRKNKEKDKLIFSNNLFKITYHKCNNLYHSKQEKRKKMAMEKLKMSNKVQTKKRIIKIIKNKKKLNKKIN